jgi:RNA polymerase sigma-70 factor (ECF subfamily)
LQPSELERFESMMLPHLSAAYGLARYLVRNEADAEDVVQEAYLRALRYFGGFRGEAASQSRAWLLTIVRNMAHTWRHRRRAESSATEFDEALHSEAADEGEPADAVLTRRDTHETLAQALDRLPPDLREVLVLREIEGLSYKEIGDVAGVPIGTVMSRLSRARKRLQATLAISGEER